MESQESQNAIKY